MENWVTADEVTAIIFKNGFKVNRQKTKEKIRGQRQMLTGLTVSNGFMSQRRIVRMCG